MATIQNFLEFTADEIPVEKIFEIEGTEYKFQIDYNEYGDFYTCTIRDINDNILLTNKLTYLSPINDSIIEGLNIKSDIVPVNYDDPDNDLAVNKENFSKISIMIVEDE